ncbi:MAG: thiamine pyrophosphate-dependent enzyme [Hyphomonadaceae bacterium]
MSGTASNLPSQKDAIARAIELYADTRPLAVADIGSQSGWLKAASHDARNLYVSGPMGLSTSIALGLAVARPRQQVLAIIGDGSMAMNFSSLLTIASVRPGNLAVLVLANNVYEFTASVPVPTRDLDWRTIGASIFGEANSYRLDDLTPEIWAKAEKPAFVAAPIAGSTSKPPPLGMSPAQIRAEFLKAVAD